MLDARAWVVQHLVEMLTRFGKHAASGLTRPGSPAEPGCVAAAPLLPLTVEAVLLRQVLLLLTGR